MLNRVLVTGAGGFVGSRLVARFAARGTRVTAVSRSTRATPQQGLVRWVHGDVTEPETYRSALRGVDGVIHLAARLTARKAADYEHTNVFGTRCLLESCAEEGSNLQRVVVVSTVAAMGPGRDDRLLTESDPCRPVTAYGASKLAAEEVALALAARLPITILRPVFVYGPGDPRGASYLEGWLRFPPGEWTSPIRSLSLVHVDDFARSCEQALAADLPSGSTFLVASPAACDWSDVRSAVAGALDWLARDGAIDAALTSRLTARIEALDPASRGGPPPEWWACDAGPAGAALGFSGRSLADGARDTLASYAASGFFSPERWSELPSTDPDTTAEVSGTGTPQETT